jgi:two-component system CitB family sensor kinase
MKLGNKIMLLTIVVIMAVIGVISNFAMKMVRDKVNAKNENYLLDTAEAVASVPLIEDELEKGVNNFKIQTFTEKLNLKMKVNFIVVIDMNGIRYSHPLRQYIGMPFEGGDDKRVLESGESYISEGLGRIGYSVRAFAPVYKEGIQVGAVCVGILKTDWKQEATSFMYKLIPYIGLAFIIGVIGAYALSNNIKKTIFGLEPKEIALLVEERKAVIDNTNDGLIAINTKGEITVLNKKAKEILNIDDKEYIYPIILNNLKEVLETGEEYYNRTEKLSDDTIILSNYKGITGNEGNIIGALVNFQDRSLVTKMAEELTGIKLLTWDLRAQNHEFMNKLHTIAGLIQLERYDKALKYIFDVSEMGNKVVESLKKIEDVSIQGLILAKYHKAQEAKIKFIIEESCNLKKEREKVGTHDLLTIIGNLLDNSIDALKDKENGEMSIFISEEDNIIIQVRNNGEAIKEEIGINLFDRGFTTKNGDRGYGLYNVKEILDSLGGEISFTSGKITEWKVEI